MRALAGSACGMRLAGAARRQGVPTAPGRRRCSVAVRAAMRLSNRNNQREPRAENVQGDFFVDHTCIDCDTCRWIAPGTYARVGEQSAVVAQPAGHEARVQAMMALLSCPTYSIHVASRTPEELREAQRALPAPVAGCPGVYYTGWASEKSYAGTAYLIVRPGGNILVDSPRYNPALAKRLEEMGGVRYMFLTHKDDVGDHDKWAAHLGATRILHSLECNARQGTDKVEVKLEGEGPWALRADGSVVPIQSHQGAAAARSSSSDGAPGTAPAPGQGQGPGAGAAAAAADDDVTLVFTPGHSRGHVCLYYAPAKAMFTGDHLCAHDDKPGELYIFEDFNWYSVDEQRRSVAKLLDYDFMAVLPAHGRRAALRDTTHRLEAVGRLLGAGAAAQSE